MSGPGRPPRGSARHARGRIRNRVVCGNARCPDMADSGFCWIARTRISYSRQALKAPVPLLPIRKIGGILGFPAFVRAASVPDHLGIFDWVSIPLYVALLTFMLTRFGVLALIIATSVKEILTRSPLTTDLSTWYAGSTVFPIVCVLALTAYGVYTALAGRPLFKAGFLENV